MKLVRIQLATFSLALRRMLAHRANLAFDFINMMTGISVLILTTLVVYLHTPLLAGWSQAEALVLTGTYAIVAGLRGAFVDPSLGAFVLSIRDGSFDAHLLRPTPSWFTTTCNDHAPFALGQSLAGLGIMVAGLSGLDRFPSPLDAAIAVIMILMALVVSWAISLSVASLGFWSGRLELSPLVESLWEIGRYPAGMYRQPIRTILIYLVPLAGMITFPAEALTKAWSWEALAASLVGAVLMVSLALTLFHVGLRRYTGATS